MRKYQLHLLTFSDKMFCKQSPCFMNKTSAEATVTYTSVYILVSVRHHNAMKMSKMLFFPYISQVYSKTVIALYLDFILSYFSFIVSQQKFDIEMTDLHVDLENVRGSLQ